LQEGVVIIRQAVDDLIDDPEPVPAQDARLPQCENGPPERVLVSRLFIGGHALLVTFREQPSDFHLAIDRALAPHFGRVGRQHRDDHGGFEKVLQIGLGQTGLLGQLERVGHGPVTGHGRSQRVGACLDVGTRPPDVMLVLGDVR